MRITAPMSLIASALALWALYWAGADYSVFGGISTSKVLLWTAWLVTALVLVVVIGRLLFVVGFSLLDREATGLQRGMIYAVLTFVIVSAILGSLGMNIGAILTTSVVATAIVGLAIQPTLGSLIAGSALQLDRVLRVGDILLRNDERIEVLALQWRSIVGRKHGSRIVVIPNSRLFESEVDILRADQPARTEATVPVPLTVPPDRISDVLSEAVYDLPYIDPALPVQVQNTRYRPAEGCVECRIRFWVRHVHDLPLARTLLLSRVWYVFQRAEIPWPVSVHFSPAIGPLRVPVVDEFRGMALDQLVQALSGPLVAAQNLPADSMRGVISECGRPLCYGDGERLALPSETKEFSLFLLAEGQASESPLQAAWHTEEALKLQPGLRRTIGVSHTMQVEAIASHLARYIGPYAELAVKHAAASHADPTAIREAVALEIDDLHERKAFLHTFKMEPTGKFGPGFVFTVQSSPGFGRVSTPFLRALGRATVVPIKLETPVRIPTHEADHARA